MSQALYSEKISTSEGMETYVKVGRLPGWRRRRRRRRRNRKRKRDRENQAAAVTQRSKSWNRRQHDSNTRLSSTECKRGERRCEGAESGSSSRGAESRTASEDRRKKRKRRRRRTELDRWKAMKSLRFSHEEPLTCRACITVQHSNNTGITTTEAELQGFGSLCKPKFFFSFVAHLHLSTTLFSSSFYPQNVLLFWWENCVSTVRKLKFKLQTT